MFMVTVFRVSAITAVMPAQYEQLQMLSLVGLRQGERERKNTCELLNDHVAA